MMTTSYILWNVFLGALGVAYLSYAKSQKKIVSMLGGIVLLGIPYFTENVYYYVVALILVVVVSYKFNY